jgi:hypothetical protein
MEGTDRQQGGPVGGAAQDLWIEAGQGSEIRCNYHQVCSDYGSSAVEGPLRVIVVYLHKGGSWCFAKILYLLTHNFMSC